MIDMDSAPKINRAEALVYLGYFIILLFKNISSNNYLNFFNKRLHALKALAGCYESANIAPVFKQKMASQFKIILESYRDLCRQVIDCLQEEKSRGKDVGIVANYILDIISWTDMSAHKWIYECLMLTGSLVFYHDAVKAEIKPLCQVMDKIVRCKYPQHFLYYDSLEDVGKQKVKISTTFIFLKEDSYFVN